MSLALTVAVVVAVAFVARRSSHRSSLSNRDNPLDATVRESPTNSLSLDGTTADVDQLDRYVGQMLDTAQDGDVPGYLDCFTGPLRQKLAARLQNMSETQASSELQTSQAGLKSYVITDWQHISSDEATLTLERVYADSNQRHRVRLSRSHGQWRIVELTPLDSYAPEIPYGTPVFQPPPDAEDEYKPGGIQER